MKMDDTHTAQSCERMCKGNARNSYDQHSTMEETNTIMHFLHL